MCVCFVCSAVLSALGNLLSQALESKKKPKGQAGKEVDVSGPLRFAVYGYDHLILLSFICTD